MDAPITINGEAPNLFRGLLAYRPRIERESKENFLTEAFAYVLAMDPKVAAKIIEAFVEDRFEVKRLLSIETQVSLRDAESRGLGWVLSVFTETLSALERDESLMRLLRQVKEY